MKVSKSEDNSTSTILFNQSKNELFKLDNLKVLQRKLKSSWRLEVNREEITGEVLSDVGVFVSAGPREAFSQAELEALKKYLENGGSLLVSLNEGGEKKFQTNINYLLEEFGIMINTDLVVRTHYHRYLLSLLLINFSSFISFITTIFKFWKFPPQKY
jgi:intraflagellar transport protein 52